MGARGSSLVGKAVVDEKFMPYTAYQKRDVLLMRERHLHDLGGRFALGRRQFASLLQENEGGDNLHILFDTDKNGLVDALEVIAAFTMLSSMSVKDKMDTIHSLYDFNGTGTVTLDEMTIMLRTVASGTGKLDKGIVTPTTRQMEELSKWAFKKANLDSDAVVSKSDFDDFCLTNPTVRSFLDYWSGGSHQVALARGELFSDPAFKANGTALYYSLTDAPIGMLPAHTVNWLRPKQLCPGTPRLYSDGGLGNQLSGSGSLGGALRAGQFANQWFLSALSLVASQPQLLRSLFVWTGQEKQGRFCVRFFKGEKWQNVVIDDQLPCDALGQPLFAKSVDPNELWPMLIEKAYAKLHTCYQNLLMGSVEYALRDLTGATIERHDMSSKDFQLTRATLGDRRDALWKHLYTCANHTLGFSGHVVGCAWTKPTMASAREGGTLQGLQFAVMHTVVGVLEYKQFRLLRVQNPWGASFFNGDWSNGSLLWSQAPPALVDLALKVSGSAPQPSNGNGNGGNGGANNTSGVNAPPPVPGGGGDGSDYMKPLGLNDPTCFWISLEDFLQLFDVLVIAHVHDSSQPPAPGRGGGGGWSHQYRRVVLPASGGGNPQEPTWAQNPQFFLEASERTEVQVSFSQPDARWFGQQRAPHLQSLGFLIHQYDWGPDHTCVKPLEKLVDLPADRSASSGGESGLVARTELFQAKREVSLAEPVVLEAGKYVLLPMVYQPAEEAPPTTPLTRQCHLSVFSKSPLYPLKLYSDAEVEYDDPHQVLEGTNEIDAEFTEDLTTPGPDVETDNETVAIAALSELISKMWTVARQLEFRKQDLEEKVAFLEDEKRRVEEEAAEAAAAAADEGA